MPGHGDIGGGRGGGSVDVKFRAWKERPKEGEKKRPETSWGYADTIGGDEIRFTFLVDTEPPIREVKVPVPRNWKELVRIDW